jgi:hypothetical protein
MAGEDRIKSTTYAQHPRRRERRREIRAVSSSREDGRGKGALGAEVRTAHEFRSGIHGAARPSTRGLLRQRGEGADYPGPTRRERLQRACGRE